MKPAQAKEILLRYRPGASDDSEPEMAEAIEVARQNSDLQLWFDQHCTWQAQVQRQFRSIAVPAGLKERILERAAPRPILRWPTVQQLAWAAGIVLLLSLILFWRWTEPPKRFADYRDRMVRTALRDYRMQLITDDLEQIRDFLGRHRGHTDYTLPEPLAKTRGYGCAVLTWQDKPVSMICFQENERKDLYLFIINQSEVSGEPLSEIPSIARVNKLITASWSAGGKVYVLATPGDETSVRRFF
ncbi:MAG: hypothetical protein AB1813_21955 [Verrucomicrobiota bacterium]|jgi:hypothetical protein